MNITKLLFLSIISLLFISADKPNQTFDFRIRTITAGITLENLDDLNSIEKAIAFLEKSKKVFTDNGYEVQSVRISTQNLHELISGSPTKQTLQKLKKIDKVLIENSIDLAIGELISGNQYDENLADWTVELIKETSNINFSVPISSESLGIHHKTIKTASEICLALSKNSKGGEANFRFTASANCPDGIPFFPAAYHKGKNSFAIGLEYPNLITKVFEKSDWENAEANLKNELNKQFNPIQILSQTLQTSDWNYDGIDTSPAPGLDASIGQAIETLTGKPFGSPTTLSACSIITKVIKSLDVKSCGYSGLMLPIIEDMVLAKRAMEDNYTVEELLLFSSVSGTGLDVIPVAGDITKETIEGIYRDVASLSIKYFNKALSARLFPIPEKNAGDIVDFDNPYLTSSVVMKLN
ncbi:DUF711 family protein [Algoriphagus sp. D3-2-R+10]|uniref:DUF711 family protein n=1 Tax=Algoriphagus aurantiacus TaxID=3103948 RepID=UPI002B3A65B9|nr:DUF711 family protein [Algoriphagus sp. D3-2-R+10]MEB2777344.1 DUF711 family protein [Algoriphagus sp. D3-2-R+10]